MFILLIIKEVNTETHLNKYLVARYFPIFNGKIYIYKTL